MEDRQKEKLKLQLKAKSPIIMSNKNEIILHDCNMKSVLNMDDINGDSKKIQEKKVLTANTSTVQLPKSLKHLNLCGNFQSTPNTKNYKSEIDSRIIMNLSPIIPATSVETNLNSHQNVFQQKLIADNIILLDELNSNKSPLNINNDHQFVKTLNLDETVKDLIYENIKVDSPILSVEKIKNNEDNNVAENVKRCLFEKENVGSTFNLDTDQDSLNVSLDILEQVCQISEMMDGSTEKFNNENNIDKKKKLSFFLYGNNSTVLEETEEEKKLLQLTLSMEDNLLTETKLKNNISSDREFKSLTQLKDMETYKSKTESNRHINGTLKNKVSNYEHESLNSLEFNNISNTQMCEVADITEPLQQLFDDQWVQQYMENESNIGSKKIVDDNSPKWSQETSLTTDQILKVSNNFINNKMGTYGIPKKKIVNAQLILNNEPKESLSITEDKPMANICSNKDQDFSNSVRKSINISNEALRKVKSVFQNKLNESAITEDKPIASPNVGRGFLTAGGKSINISDKALKHVQSVFEDKLNESIVTNKDKPMTNPNIFQGFSTAGGKSINISNEALRKVNSVFQDELNELSAITENKPMSSPNIGLGFSTAGGKSINISEKALKHVQSVFKDELNESIVTNKDKPMTNPNIFQGFSTAGGKSINISNEALRKVNSVFQDELNELSAITENKPMASPNIGLGFSTAGGKSINISEKALKRVQSVFKDELNESIVTNKDKPMTNPNIFQGFSTAGGKSINISNEALRKVNSVFQDELNELSAITENKPMASPNIGLGFSTAGGKSINIPEKALKHVQSVFKDELNELSAINREKSLISPNICQVVSTRKEKSFKLLDSVLQKRQLLSNNDINVLPLLKEEESLESICISTNCNYSGKVLKNSIAEDKKKDKYFENARNNEDCTLEDLSLIDMVEKLEREYSVHEPVLSNKRPGSPIFEIDHEIKKRILCDSGWENHVLKFSFNEYLAKKLKGPKVSLPDAVNRNLPKLSFSDNGVNGELSKLNYEDNALNLMLHWEKNFKDSNGSINKNYSFQDIRNIFLSHDFVDIKLIPKKWIENHFCLIIWKLAATEICFPDQFGNILLTAKNVIHQLLYRYYREIEKCQRSALKMILEKDEIATKRIILCVSKIIKKNTAEMYDIDLTDGWYSIRGLIDYEMNKLLHKGIVKVGTKLIIHNAELIGAGEGIDPLEIHNGVKLKISTNSTRRARWYAKLGFYKNPSLPITVSLESVLPRGGIIGSLSLIILRKYPMMYLEKKINSKSILRNEKMENIEIDKFKAYQQKSLEIISNKIKTEMIAEIETTKKSKKYDLRIKKEDLDKLSIEELSNIIDNSPDPLDIQSLLKQDKLEAIEHFKKSEHEKFYNELQSRVNKVFIDQFKDTRKVIPLFKLRVVDEKYATTGCKAAMLTIWNPLEDVSTILNKYCEGQLCTIHYLTSNGFINNELQISANKNTRFNFQGFKKEYAKRDVILCFKSIWSDTFLPLFGELDFVGIVVSGVHKTNNIFNEIYVSDKEMNIISILFKGDIKNYGCDDIIYFGNIISGMNVQFRGFNKSNESPIPNLYNTELSSFTTIPKTEFLLNIFNDYKMFMNNVENSDFLNCCQSKLNEILSKKVEIPVTSNESTRKQYLNSSNNSFNRSYGELPVKVVKTSNTFQSEFSPAQKRIKMLNNYGKTPPLNIVHTKLPDKKLMSQFKTPTRLS